MAKLKTVEPQQPEVMEAMNNRTQTAITQHDVLSVLASRYAETKTKSFIKTANNAVKRINDEYNGNMDVTITRRNDDGEIVSTETKTLNNDLKESFNLVGNKESILSMFAPEDVTLIKGKLNASIRRTAQTFYKGE